LQTLWLSPRPKNFCFTAYTEQAKPDSRAWELPAMIWNLSIGLQTTAGGHHLNRSPFKRGIRLARRDLADPKNFPGGPGGPSGGGENSAGTGRGLPLLGSRNCGVGWDRRGAIYSRRPAGQFSFRPFGRLNPIHTGFRSHPPAPLPWPIGETRCLASPMG